MAAASPARRSTASVLEAAWLFGTVTERLAIRADRRLSTPFEQGESGAKRPDSNPGAFFEPKCSDRLRCEHAHPSLPPVYFAQWSVPGASTPYALRDHELTPSPCARPSVQVPQAEEGKAAHTMLNNLALFALDCFVPVCEPSSPARDAHASCARQNARDPG